MTQAEERVNSFADLTDLSDLKPKKTPSKKPDKAIVDVIAKETGFVSRQANVDRRTRFRTGRNQQLNLKVTQKALEDFYNLADEMVQPLGAVFEEAVNALIEKRKKTSK